MFSGIRNFVRRQLGLTVSAANSGSAFAKLVDHDNAIKEAQGRIIALGDAHYAKNTVLTELEKARDVVHAASERIKNRAEALLATL